MTQKTHRNAGEVFRLRMREIRGKRGWSQADLAKRLVELGVDHLSRGTLSKIELPDSTRAHNLSLDDALAIAAALGVSPVNMMLPTWHGDQVAITPKLTVPAGSARAWVRGYWPLRHEDERIFFTEIAPEEGEELLKQAKARRAGEGMPSTEYMAKRYEDDLDLPSEPRPRRKK